MPMKSEKGPRNVRLTVLVPQSVMNDLRALRESTFQSTGDLVNNLIEKELARQADAVKEGYEFLKLQESREAKARARANPKPTEASPGSASEESPRPPKMASETPAEVSKGHSLDYPTKEDVTTWSNEASEKKVATQRRSDGLAYLEWLQSTGKNIGEFSANEYYEVLKERYDNKKTLGNHIGRVRNFVRWWNIRNQ